MKMKTVLRGKIRDEKDAEGAEFLAKMTEYVRANKLGVYLVMFMHEDGCPGIGGDLDACTCDPLDVELRVPLKRGRG